MQRYAFENKKWAIKLELFIHLITARHLFVMKLWPPVKVRYMEKNLNITRPRYRELTLSLPWPFAISRLQFHWQKVTRRNFPWRSRFRNRYYSIPVFQNYVLKQTGTISRLFASKFSGADHGFFLGGGAPVSYSTSTPINHIVFLSQNTSCIRKPKVISGGGAHPLHPPPRSAPGSPSFTNTVKPRV